MNKALITILLASLLAACGGGNPSTDPPSSPPSTTTIGGSTPTNTFAQTATYNNAPLPGLICDSPEYPIGVAHTWGGTISQSFAASQSFNGQSGLVAVTSAITLQGCAATVFDSGSEPVSETDYYAQSSSAGGSTIALIGSTMNWNSVLGTAQTLQAVYGNPGLVVYELPLQSGRTWSSSAARTLTWTNGTNGGETLSAHADGSYTDNLLALGGTVFPYQSTTTVENSDASGSRTEVYGANASAPPYTVSLSAPSNNTVTVSTSGTPPVDPVLPTPTPCPTAGGTPCPLSNLPTPYPQHAWYPYVPTAAHPLETIISTDKGSVAIPASCNVSSTFPKSAELIETVDSTLDIWTGTTISTTDAYVDAHDGVLCANVAVQSTYFALGSTSADTTPTGGSTLTFTDALQTQTSPPAVFAVPALARYLSLWR